MNLSVSTNWDNNLIEKLNKLNKLSQRNKVYEVFGSNNLDFLGSARPADILPVVSWDQIKDHIDLCHARGIKFNYLINSLSFKNKEFNPLFRKRLIKLVQKLVSFKIDSLTLTNPLFIEVIRDQFPDLHICVSTVSKVDCLQKVEWYSQLKVNRIILETDVNRDFSLLSKICSKKKLEFEVIANLQCILKCPNNTYDYICDGFRSQNLFDGVFYNYPKIKCANLKLKNPIELIKSPWIRPEDLHLYDKIGVSFIKIAGREAPTNWIIKAVEAYLNEHYEGNLFDLIGNQVISFIGLLSLKNYKSLKPLTLYLDNKKLSGFLDFFVQGSCSEDCKRCNYCKKWVRFLRFDNQQKELYLQRSDLLLSLIRKNQI